MSDNTYAIENPNKPMRRIVPQKPKVSYAEPLPKPISVSVMSTSTYLILYDDGSVWKHWVDGSKVRLP